MKKDIGFVEKVKRSIRRITLLWNYFTVFTLISFGISFLSPKKMIPYASIVFAVALIFFILTTSIYIIGPKKKRETEEKRNKRSIVKILYKITKICITILPFFTLNNDLSVNFAYPNLMKALSIAWLIIQVGIEISFFILKLIIKKITKQMKSDNN